MGQGDERIRKKTLGSVLVADILIKSALRNPRRAILHIARRMSAPPLNQGGRVNVYRSRRSLTCQRKALGLVSSATGNMVKVPGWNWRRLLPPWSALRLGGECAFPVSREEAEKFTFFSCGTADAQQRVPTAEPVESCKYLKTRLKPLRPALTRQKTPPSPLACRPEGSSARVLPNGRTPPGRQRFAGTQPCLSMKP